MADLNRLGENRFLVLGRAGMDLYPDPPGTSIEEARRFTACLGGSSGNIAAGLARHGAQVALVTRLSQDPVGQFCLKELENYGIEASYVTTSTGETRTSLALAESRLENHQAVLYRNGAADFEMSSEDVQKIDYTRFSALIATGTCLAAEPSRSATFKAFETARAAGLPVIFDIDYRPYSWPSADIAAETYSRAADLCDIIIGNDVEFGFMAGDYDQGLAKARQLAADSAQIVVYKMGEKGAITLTKDGETQTGIFQVQALKPVGAGDAFMGGFVASLAAGHSVKDAVTRGSACASIVVARVGCAPAMPTPAELTDFLNTHPGPTLP